MAVKAWIDQDGIHVPEYPEVLADIQDAFREIYGKDVYLEPDSQDGALCAVFALRLYDCYTLAVSVYNSFSPATAQGAGLSSVVKTNGIRRRIATRSQVGLRLVGRYGTVISNGVVRDESGKRWLLPARVVIGKSGEVAVTARAEDAGDIRAAAGDIRHIATPVRGWQSVSNPQAAVPGAPVETDAGLRRRQAVSTALPSLTVFDGTAGAVAQVAGVLRSRGYENDTSTPDDNGLPPHSIAFVVEGGDPEDIARAIAAKKTPGTGTYGDVAVELADKHGSTATIRFWRPTIVRVTAHVHIRPLPGYVSTTAVGIAGAVAAAINGLAIGEDVLLSRLYTPVNAAEPDPAVRTFDVLSITLSANGAASTAANLEIAFNEAVACEADGVTVQDYGG